MRIAIFTDAFLPQLNGVVTYVTETAQKLIKRGHEVLVFAPRPKDEVRLNLGKFSFKVIFLPSLPALFYPDIRITIPTLPKSLVILRKFKVEVIHIQAPFTVGTEGLVVAKILKIPLVATFHSFYIDKPFFGDLKLEKFADRLHKPLWNLYASFHNLADTVVCPTKIAQSELVKYGLAKPSIVIPHGINLSSIEKGFRTDISTIQRKFSLKPTDRIAIFSGRLAADKSIEILINVWRKVVRRVANAKLLIIGSGPVEQTLKLMVKRSKLTGKVIFTGGLSRETLIEKGMLRVGHIAVSASKIENPSYALLEAMAFGLPIVAFCMRGIPEIVDSNNGILVVPDDIDAFADKVIELLTDEEKLKQLSIGAKKKASEFDIEKNIKQLEKLYMKLIEKK